MPGEVPGRAGVAGVTDTADGTVGERKVLLMSRRRIAAFALALLAGAAGAAPVGGEPATMFEARVLKALADGDRAGLRSLAGEYRGLSPAARRALPLRVREDSVEFAFRGEFVGDQFSPEMLEYLVSGPGRDYEALLVARGAELGRVQALLPFFARRAGEGRRRWWSARLVWAERDAPQSVDLGDLLIRLGARERDRFLDGLGINSVGLGGDLNVNADVGLLPRRRVPARLLLTIRVVPEG
jgi:hypothetical protein